MGSMFQKATRKKLQLRMAITGPAKAGKTFTALRFAFGLAGKDGRIAVIDTEHRAASKYQGPSIDNTSWDFDTCELEYFAPSTYTQTIEQAGRDGYDVLVIDSLSHAWEGVGGALEQVNAKGGNKYTSWKDVTPMHRAMVEAILASPCHVIATMRSKTEYILEENDKGKQIPRRVGMAPVQRPMMEYEFDLVCDMDLTHQITISGTRCSAMDGRTAVKPDAGFIAPLVEWLGLGVDVVTEQPAATTEALQAQADTGKPEVNIHCEPCNSEQLKCMVALAKQLGMPREAFINMIGKRGAAKAAHLNHGQALEIISSLEARKTQKEAAATF